MIAWTDIESTGLEEDKHDLLEVAIAITDDDLNVYRDVSVLIKPVSFDAMYARCDAYVRHMHERSGLFEALRGATLCLGEAEGVLMRAVQDALSLAPDVPSGRCAKCSLGKSVHATAVPQTNPPVLMCADGTQMIERLDPPAKHTPMAGSTIPFDRRWLRRYMPKLEGMFSHRSIDVSTVTELAKRWCPSAYRLRSTGETTHRALDDIKGSIDTLRWYKRCGFLASDFDEQVHKLTGMGVTVERKAQ